MSASLAIFLVGPLRMVTPAQITNIVENRNHEIPAIVVYLFIDLLLFSLSLSTFLSPVARVLNGNLIVLKWQNIHGN